MADPRALRRKRLENEYDELMRINGEIIRIIPIGIPPYEAYKVTFNIRTIISPAPTYRNQTVCTLTIPPNYPDAPPVIVADNTPYPWHINWFQSGRWCLGGWNREESLVNCLHRCARTLQFDPEMANSGSVANRDAMSFWNANKNNKKVIPSDIQVLPVLDVPETITINARHDTPKIVIQHVDKPKISIIRKG
jgi:ubiquitin-protein ligase